MNLKQDVLPLLKETASEFQKDEASQLGAALAYYAMFSIFPLLLLLIALLGYVLRYWDAAIDVREQILNVAAQNFSPNLSKNLRDVLANVEQQAGGATIVGLVTLLFGASGVFQQLDWSFNKIWQVPAQPAPSGIIASVWNTVRTRLFSFGMVLGAGFLLLVSLVLTAITQALLDGLKNVPAVGGAAGFLGGLAVTLLLSTVVFALLFKYLPNTRVLWRDVWAGALVTAVLWEIGKRLLALYVGALSYTSAYGAVGTVLVLMIWVYFSSQILFLGAEFTEVSSRRFGSRAPKPAASEPASSIEHPAVLPAAPAAPAESATGKVAVAAGAGLLVGVLGSLIAAITALIVGVVRLIAPLRRRLKQ